MKRTEWFAAVAVGAMGFAWAEPLMAQGGTVAVRKDGASVAAAPVRVVQRAQSAGEAAPAVQAAQLEMAAYLGVGVEPADEALESQLGLPRGIGLVVNHVDLSSPAAAVVRKNDVLRKLDDQLLVNQEQLAVLVRLHKPGEKLTLDLVREGKAVTVEAVLTGKELPPLSAHGSADMPRLFFGPPTLSFAPGTASRSATAVSNADGSLEYILKDIDVKPGSAMTMSISAKKAPMSGSATVSDGKYTMTATTSKDGSQKAVVTDADGQTVYQGDPKDKDAIEKLPAEIREGISRLLKLQDAIQVRMQPSAQPPDSL